MKDAWNVKFRGKYEKYNGDKTDNSLLQTSRKQWRETQSILRGKYVTKNPTTKQLLYLYEAEKCILRVIRHRNCHLCMLPEKHRQTKITGRFNQDIK